MHSYERHLAIAAIELSFDFAFVESASKTRAPLTDIFSALEDTL
jgi:hypothetical protein